jgi:hypothetical protein
VSRGNRVWNFSTALVVTVVAGAMTLTGVLINTFHDPPTHPNCPAARRTAQQIYNQDPRAGALTYPQSSPIETQCQINEFIGRLEGSGHR